MRKMQPNDRWLLMIHMHDYIDESIRAAIANINNEDTSTVMCYPPAHDLERTDVALLRELLADEKRKSIIAKLMIDSAGAAIFELLSVLDGAVEIPGSRYETLQLVECSLSEADALSDDEWHDFFHETYQDWRSQKRNSDV